MICFFINAATVFSDCTFNVVFFRRIAPAAALISFLTKKALKFKRILINTVFKGINKEKYKGIYNDFTTIEKALYNDL